MWWDEREEATRKARMNYHSVARNANGMAYLSSQLLLFSFVGKYRWILLCNTIGLSTPLKDL